MHSMEAHEKARLLSWRHVREFAVPASMIETTTARRSAGDWAGACAAAHVDADLDLRAVAGARGREFAALVRADLRRLAPDLLRWHLPRTMSDGLLRPGLTVSLARYPAPESDVHLVVRTAPSWADAGQRLSLALWDAAAPQTGPHPRPRPDRRFRLDLHPHLWAADRAPELGERCGATERPRFTPAAWTADVPTGRGCAVHRWAAEAAILRAADRHDGPVTVRLGNGRRLLMAGDAAGIRTVRARGGTSGAVLPYAATWLPPDLELLRAGMIEAERLHPLVAGALDPGAGQRPPAATATATGRTAAGTTPWLVACQGETHRLAIAGGTLVPLDHEPDELRREELLAALGGPQLPCLRIIATAGRTPDCLDEIRARLNHGDQSGARALVTDLLGPGARPDGALRDAFTTAEQGRIQHGLYRAGLAARVPAGVSVPVGSRTDRPGRRGRDHRAPRRAPVPR